MPHFPNVRMRRLRKSPQLRNLVRETNLNINKLILPIFIRHGSGIKKPVAGMPGHFQLSVDQLEEEVRAASALGIRQILLFGIPEQKDALGQDAYSDQGIIQQAIPVIKEAVPDMLIISDICFCEYTDHGHCGVLCGTDNDVHNDQTLELLKKQAVSHARAGVDIVAPSGNMDGMVQAIRQALDEAGFKHLPILSYSVKYASSLYDPFREAAEGAPGFGDRRRYQMDYGNVEEAIRECSLDVAEGADMLMVKPAHAYLDVICRVKQAYPALPLCAYHTSGEYAMIKAAAEKGWVNERKTAMEVTTAIQRAGADFIITYYAKELAQWLSVSD